MVYIFCRFLNGLGYSYSYKQKVFAPFYLTRGLAFFKSKEERREGRKNIMKEIGKEGNYVKDLNELRHTEGKRFYAPGSLYSLKETLLFPNMETESLKGDKIILPTDMRGTPALILIFMKAHGLKMSERYRIPFMENFGGSIPVYEVNVLELVFFRLLRRFLQANLRQQIEARRHEHFLCHYGNFYGIKNRLDIHSSMVSYAFLLDNKGWVRWRCHGYPTGQEIQYLINCTKDLLLISREEHKQ